MLLLGLLLAGWLMEIPDSPAYPVTVPCQPGQPPPRYATWAVTTKDQTDLTLHVWSPPRAEPGKPVMLLLHGIGLHGKPYASVAAGFCRHGLVLVAPDLRGHGASGGTRGEMAEITVLRTDLEQILDELARRFPQSPIILMGESMGGLLAAECARTCQKRLAGLALLAPAFMVHPSRFKVQPGDVFQMVLNFRIPIATLDHLEPSTRDPGFITARQADPCCINEVQPGYLLKLGMLGVNWPLAASELTLPLYIGLPEKDQIIESRVARWTFTRAATPPYWRTLQEWPGACHTLFWDPVAPDLVDTVARWALQVTAP